LERADFRRKHVVVSSFSEVSYRAIIIRMSRVIPIHEASGQLRELVHGLLPGDEIVLTEDDQPMARIVADTTSHKPRKAGACKGMLEIVDDGDDAVLDNFKDYIP
jgi:antitoxin (DNA-binding transcriptional repressor) of toxin-antitoxin stability system